MPITFKETDEGGTETYILSDNGVTVGNIKINFDLQAIMDICVEEKLRKKGYGTQLIDDAEKRFIQKGIMKISTDLINEEFLGFWIKVGYNIEADGTGTKNLGNL